MERPYLRRYCQASDFVTSWCENWTGRSQRNAPDLVNWGPILEFWTTFCVVGFEIVRCLFDWRWTEYWIGRRYTFDIVNIIRLDLESFVLVLYEFRLDSIEWVLPLECTMWGLTQFLSRKSEILIIGHASDHYYS